MQLEGSCHCGQVSFRLESAHPYPFNLCYCSICRKTAGGGGYAINLGGNFSTLEVTGEENTTVYRAMVTDPETGATIESPARRHFCHVCGSALWAWDPRWPDLVHPFASAICVGHRYGTAAATGADTPHDGFQSVMGGNPGGPQRQTL
jgi:hypothetical protein